MYYLAQIVLVISAIILAIKTKEISAYLCAAGFAAFLSGNIMLMDVSKTIVEIEQTHGNLASLENDQMIGRVLSPVGFLAAGVGLFVFAVSRKSASS